MQKVIKIGDKNVRLEGNTSWIMEYRDQFGKDVLHVLMPVLNTITESFSAILSEATTEDGAVDIKAAAQALRGNVLDVTLPLYQLELVDIVNIAWAMAKAADESIEPPKEWLKQFDTFPLDVIIKAEWELISRSWVSSKNLTRLKKSASETLAKLQPSQSKTSFSLA